VDRGSRLKLSADTWRGEGGTRFKAGGKASPEEKQNGDEAIGNGERTSWKELG